jgi:hypothetical protein
MVDDLNDPLGDLFDSAAPARPTPALPAGYIPAAQQWQDGYNRCGGPGSTRWGVCYRCNGSGKGKRVFTTSPQERAANRAGDAARKTNA